MNHNTGPFDFYVFARKLEFYMLLSAYTPCIDTKENVEL